MLAGDPASALAHFVEALAIRREIGDRRYEAESLNQWASPSCASPTSRPR